MQAILEQMLFALVGAILILVTLVSLGFALAFREEIAGRNVTVYASIIGTPVLLISVVYLYMQGMLNSDILFMAIVLFLPTLLCTDWTKIWSP